MKAPAHAGVFHSGGEIDLASIGGPFERQDLCSAVRNGGRFAVVA
jgi:hypothetical protein